MSLDSLTVKQRLFVEAYIADPNATKAAKLAGYSEKTAYSYGQQLLKNLEIQKALGERITQATMSADEVLAELRTVGIHKPDKKDIKTSDKLKALELIGKYHKLFTDRTEIQNSSDQAREIAKKVVEELIAKGDDPQSAAQYAATKYGVLESELVA